MGNRHHRRGRCGRAHAGRDDGTSQGIDRDTAGIGNHALSTGEWGSSLLLSLLALAAPYLALVLVLVLAVLVAALALWLARRRGRRANALGPPGLRLLNS